MKKSIVIMLSLLFILCGCEQNAQNQSLPQAESIIASEYPIVLVDTTNSSEYAHVVCFGTKGEVKPLDTYVCDGKELGEFVNQDNALSGSSVLDLSRKFKLVDNQGNYEEIQPVSMQCTERVLDETLLLNVSFEPSLSTENEFYIGTYSGVDIFPEQVTYQDNTMQVDLDGDGRMDKIAWAFAPTTTDYKLKKDYTISVSRNGENYSLVEETYIPLEEEDLAVFAADLDTDGEYEILVYANGMSQFGHLTVYRFLNNQYSVMLNYAVDCEP